MYGIDTTVVRAKLRCEIRDIYEMQEKLHNYNFYVGYTQNPKKIHILKEYFDILVKYFPDLDIKIVDRGNREYDTEASMKFPITTFNDNGEEIEIKVKVYCIYKEDEQ